MEGKVASVYTMRSYGGVELHSFLTLSLDGGEWSALCSGHLSLGKVSLHYPFYRRLVVPQRQYGCFKEEKSLLSGPLHSLYADCTVLAPYVVDIIASLIFKMSV